MKKIIFAGGGTAGHVMPNLALIDALRSNYECVYAGGDGMEKELCASHGVPFYRIDTVKLRRDAIFKNAAVPFKLRGCVKSAKRVIDEVKPDLIFSKGGYAALPMVLAAKHVPLIAHESDFSPGIVTKLCRRRAEKILCAFEPCADRFDNGVYVGTPLRKSLYSGHKISFGFAENKPVLLVMAGSSGAAALNAVVADALPALLKTFNVVHLTGKNKRGANAKNGYRTMEFCDSMPDLYASVDIAVTRAGANALAELIALKIPALAVPLEKASRGDQIQNADYFGGKGAIAVARESELTADALVAAVVKTYENRKEYAAEMSRLQIDGTDKICDIIKEVLHSRA